jgi:hypothetical protein
MTAPRQTVFGIVVITGLLMLPQGGARAQIADPAFPSTNGAVFTTSLAGNTLYFAGDFNYVGPETGGFVAIDATSGSRRPGWPRVEGHVYTAAPDGAGGWYLGGVFSNVAGVPRRNLAHIRSDGTLDAWGPEANGLVHALAVSGYTVYAAGRFTSIGGESRNYLAALDASTGLPTPWDPSADASVLALAVRQGLVYVGGEFTSVGGEGRIAIAALDSSTGLSTPWNPHASSGVRCLAVSENAVYAGGYFSHIGGQARSFVAALDPATGLATPWDPEAWGPVRTLAVSEQAVYVGGEFSRVGGQARRFVAALDVTTGWATNWNPDPNGNVLCLAFSGPSVYLGGEFSTVGGQARDRLAAVDATSGLASTWAPGAGGSVACLSTAGGSVFAGGTFNIVGGQTRGNLAAVDVTTGAVTAWDPGAADFYPYHMISAIAVHEDTIYVGGDFTSVGGHPRRCIAAVDASTGLPLAWNPGMWSAPGDFPFVTEIALDGGTVYVGGHFLGIGGQSRSNIAALNASTGLAKAWNPGVEDGVSTFAVDGNKIYAGGGFDSIGGTARSRIAALDVTSGQALDWDPSASTAGWQLSVNALLVSESTIYAGGWFDSIGRQKRGCIAALDAVTGLATPWDPTASDGVMCLALNGSTIYAGGLFTSIGGQPRNFVASLDVATGSATAWNPNASHFLSPPFVGALVVEENKVYVGGRFSRIGGHGAGGLAKLLPSPGFPPSVVVNWPNGGEIVFTGTTRLVTWDAMAGEPGIQSVDLYVSRTGPTGPWELVAAGVPNTGRYPWVVTGGSAPAACYLRVEARDWGGTVVADFSDGAFSIISVAGVSETNAGTEPALEPPAPNPIHSESATIAFVLPRSSRVRLTLLDVQGREAALLADGVREPGRHTATLEAGRLRPGLYFLRLETAGQKLQKRAIILR